MASNLRRSIIVNDLEVATKSLERLARDARHFDVAAIVTAEERNELTRISNVIFNISHNVAGRREAKEVEAL